MVIFFGHGSAADVLNPNVGEQIKRQPLKLIKVVQHFVHALLLQIVLRELISNDTLSDPCGISNSEGTAQAGNLPGS